jgi:hypothetical protein
VRWRSHGIRAHIQGRTVRKSESCYALERRRQRSHFGFCRSCRLRLGRFGHMRNCKRERPCSRDPRFGAERNCESPRSFHHRREPRQRGVHRIELLCRPFDGQRWRQDYQLRGRELASQRRSKRGPLANHGLGAPRRSFGGRAYPQRRCPGRLTSQTARSQVLPRRAEPRAALHY